MMAKRFLSPQQKSNRRFALRVIKEMLESQDYSSMTEDQKRLFDSLKEFMVRQEKEDYEKEMQYDNFVKRVERDIIMTMQVCQQNSQSKIGTITPQIYSLEHYQNIYGYNPLVALGKGLTISYNDQVANEVFDKCVALDNDQQKYLNTAIDLIKYTDFVPNQYQVHTLNQASKAYNSTCKEKEQKVHPKRILKNFYNVQVSSAKKGNENALTDEQTNVA